MTAHRLRTAGRNARITAPVTSFVDFLRAVADTSRAATALGAAFQLLKRSWADSIAETGASHGVAASSSIVRGSLLVSTSQTFSTPLIRAVESAAITDVAEWTEDPVRASWLYRWLTAEPEPEVIVIDLRETISVGPVITLLNQSLSILLPACHRSTVVDTTDTLFQTFRVTPIRTASFVLGVAILTNLAVILTIGEPTLAGVIALITILGIAALGTRVTMSWDELVETRGVRLLIAVLEPPEPPEDEDR